MDIQNVILKIIEIPLQFHKLSNVSSITLLKESGYYEVFDEINESEIANALTEHPNRINDWLIWSEDKRVSSGWYFFEKNESQYIVGYWPKNQHSELQYSDKTLACAAFIKREIEAIRL